MSLPRYPTTAIGAALLTLTIFLTHPSSVHATTKFECPAGRLLSSLYSVYSNLLEERVWTFGCSPAPGGANPTDCQWTEDFVNTFHNPSGFECPTNYAIAGVESQFDKSAKDSRMKFKCCQDPAFTTQSCEISRYLNNWDSRLRHRVPTGKVLTGWFSIYSDDREDRMHKTNECSYIAK